MHMKLTGLWMKGILGLTRRLSIYVTSGTSAWRENQTPGFEGCGTMLWRAVNMRLQRWTLTYNGELWEDSSWNRFLFRDTGYMIFIFYIFLERKTGRQTDIESLISCSTYLCIHLLFPVCALTGDRTHNLGVSGRWSHQLSYPARGKCAWYLHASNTEMLIQNAWLHWTRPRKLKFHERGLGNCGGSHVEYNKAHYFT